MTGRHQRVLGLGRGLPLAPGSSQAPSVHASLVQSAPMWCEFGQFSLDFKTRELRRSGELCPVQPKVFDVLQYLVTHRERVVSKEELLSALWPGVVVTQGVLTTALRLLRRTLGDDARAPCFIKTVHGLGYRFIASVRTAPRPTVALEQVRHTRFVGRRAELEALDTFRGSAGSALLLVGMPGIGKSTLLDEWTYRARANGQTVARWTGAQLSPVPDVIRRTLTAALEGLAQNAVLIFDDYDALVGIDDWFRHDILPLLAPRKIVLAAQRCPDGWATDAAADLLQTLPLTGFGAEDGARVLSFGREVSDFGEALSVHVEGHPLSLRLIGALDPEAQRALLRTAKLPLPALAQRFAAAAQSERHRAALDVAALVVGLDEACLEQTLGGPATQLYDWLASLSFVSLDADGLRMHPAAAAALLGRLAERNRGRFAELAEQTLRIYVGRLQRARTDAERAQVSALTMALIRVHPTFEPLYDDRALDLALGLAEPSEVPRFLTFVEKHHGSGACAVHRRWMDDPESRLWVVRNARGEVLGGTLVLALTRPRGGEFDPVMRDIIGHLESVGRGDRPLLIHRVLISEDGEGPGPVLQRCHDVLNMNHHVMMGGEWRDAAVVYVEPACWMPIALASDFRPIESLGRGRQEGAGTTLYRDFDAGVGHWLDIVLHGMRAAVQQFADASVGG